MIHVPQRQAGPSRLQAVRPRTNQKLQRNTARLVVPQLEDLARQVSQRQLESVRTQVEPGERVGLYRLGDTVRMVIAGAQRLHQLLPVLLEGEWVLVGAVEITADGERSLAVVVA